MPKVHILRLAVQDLRTSSIRRRALRLQRRDLWLLYQELLWAIHEAGGELTADPAALVDEVEFFTAAEITELLPLLAPVPGKRGGIVIRNGRLRNQRIDEELTEEKAFSLDQAERGKRGARAKWAARKKADPTDKDGDRQATAIDTVATAMQPHGHPSPYPSPGPSPSPYPSPSPDPSPTPSSSPDRPRMTGSPEAREAFASAVLAEYEKVPGRARSRSTARDRTAALELFDRGITLGVVTDALTVGTARRVFRSNPGELDPIRSLDYFLPVVEELLDEPPAPGYIAHLRDRLSRAKSPQEGAHGPPHEAA